MHALETWVRTYPITFAVIVVIIIVALLVTRAIIGYVLFARAKKRMDAAFERSRRAPWR